ncbi:hypothetical protein FRC03_004208 [Tulasnella sp. 419]|nr:hypothetical protein FRC03_004208 [Tulasnella sp. 419]
MYSKFVIVIGLASAAAANSFHGFPALDKCKSAILAASSSPVSACLDTGFYKILALPEDVSRLDPLSDWLNNACALGDCDSTALVTTVIGVVDACQPDLELHGLGSLRESDWNANCGPNFTSKMPAKRSLPIDVLSRIKEPPQPLRPNIGGASSLQVTPFDSPSSTVLSPT